MVVAAVKLAAAAALAGFALALDWRLLPEPITPSQLVLVELAATMATQAAVQAEPVRSLARSPRQVAVLAALTQLQAQALAHLAVLAVVDRGVERATAALAIRPPQHHRRVTPVVAAQMVVREKEAAAAVQARQVEMQTAEQT